MYSTKRILVVASVLVAACGNKDTAPTQPVAATPASAPIAVPATPAAATATAAELRSRLLASILQTEAKKVRVTGTITMSGGGRMNGASHIVMESVPSNIKHMNMTFPNGMQMEMIMTREKVWQRVGGAGPWRALPVGAPQMQQTILEETRERLQNPNTKVEAAGTELFDGQLATIYHFAYTTDGTAGVGSRGNFDGRAWVSPSGLPLKVEGDKTGAMTSHVSLRYEYDESINIPLPN